MIALIIGIVLIGTVAMGPMMSNVETPKYNLVQSDSNIDIRKYESIIVAEVNIDVKNEDALAEGFRLLADYIFGNNATKKDIAMTAPVLKQLNGDTWNISFVMPSEYKMDSLPKPLNDRVKLKRIRAKKFVVIAFSGRNSDYNLELHEEKLMKYIKSNNLSVTGSPKYAFYNPPWTLPFMRRNEIMFEIRY
jgi:effector-binding domain-containing protein